MDIKIDDYLIDNNIVVEFDGDSHYRDSFVIKRDRKKIFYVKIIQNH